MVNQFKYLGVTINNKGRYKVAIKDNIIKARKAFYAQLRQVKKNHIPLDCHVDLFVKTIEPILLYGAEIWGFEDCKQIEQFRLRCLKIILNLRSNTPDYRVSRYLAPPLPSITGQGHTPNLYISMIPHQFQIYMQDFRSPA